MNSFIPHIFIFRSCRILSRSWYIWFLLLKYWKVRVFHRFTFFSKNFSKFIVFSIPIHLLLHPITWYYIIWSWLIKILEYLNWIKSVFNVILSWPWLYLTLQLISLSSSIEWRIYISDTLWLNELWWCLLFISSYCRNIWSIFRYVRVTK